MTNNELRQTLEGVLQGEVNEDTMLILMDCSLHVALKHGIPMEVASSIFTLFAVYHRFMEDVVWPMGNSDAPGEKGPTEEEMKRINSLLRGLNIDL